MDPFVWSFICAGLFSIGFIIIFYSADGFTKSLQTVAQKYITCHPLILPLIILACDYRLYIISIVSAITLQPYLAITTIIGSSIISLTLSIALPLISFREDPFLKLMAANLEKDEKSKISPFYFKLLCISSLTFALPLIPSFASYAYNLLSIALINALLFIVYLTKNFLKYRKSGTMDIYIPPLPTTSNNDTPETIKEPSSLSQEEKDKLRAEEDACYDNDTDDYDAIQSAKEDYDEIMDDPEEPDEKMNIMDADEIELGNLKTSAVSTKDEEEDDQILMEISKEKTEGNGLNLSNLKNGGFKKVISAWGYFFFLIFGGILTVFAMGNLCKDSAIFNERLFGYIIIPIAVNLEGIVMVYNAYKARKVSSYTLPVGNMVGRLYFNLGVVTFICGLWLRGMEWKMIDVINGVILFVSICAVSWVLMGYRMKKIYGVGLLSIFGIYMFLNMVFDEIEG